MRARVVVVWVGACVGRCVGWLGTCVRGDMRAWGHAWGRAWGPSCVCAVRAVCAGSPGDKFTFGGNTLQPASGWVATLARLPG